MTPNQQAWPRWAHMILGAWVVGSTLMWSPATATTINGCAIGALIVGAAVLAMYAPQARALNAILAVWLFASTLFLPTVSALFVSNLLTAIGVLVLTPVRGVRRVMIDEWPDIPAARGHEPFIPVVRDLVDDGRHEGRGTMW